MPPLRSPRTAAAEATVRRTLSTSWSRAARTARELQQLAGSLRAQPRRLAGLDALHVGHVELDRLGRYLVVAAFVGACLLVSAWSRIDLRRTSMQLHRTEAAFASARSEHARLRLELATLQDPSHLQQAATQLELQPAAHIVDLSTD